MNYSVSSIETLDFKQAIRKRIEMYMGSADNQGVLQCIREVISNSIDEFSIGYGDEIQISLKGNVFTCRDFGRSIPFGERDDGTEAMIAIFTTPHTGGKFNDKAYGSAVIGQNGVGIKGVALSAEYFVAKSYRDGKCAILKIENGDVKSFKIVPSVERVGTYIEFKPSQEVYRLEEIKIKPNDVREMCRDWSYLNKGLKFVLLDEIGEITYYSKEGIVDFIKMKVAPGIQSAPYFYYTEDEDGNRVEIAFQWGSKHEESYTFTNGLHNLNGGTSLTGAKTAITRTINNITKENFNGDFVRGNLCYVINAKVPHASFSDQTKMRINNPSLRPLTDRAFTEAIKEFSIRRKDEFEKVVGLLEKLSKADAAAERARKQVLEATKEIGDQKKRRLILADKLKDCKEHGSESGACLVITEGDSGLGSLAKERPIDKVALLPIRGKIISALKHDQEKILKNEEVKAIFGALDCGFLEKYNPKNLRYQYVGVASDSDEDGNNIANLITTLFFYMCPDFIKEGRLFRIKMPLFVMQYKKGVAYAFSPEERDEIIKKNGKPKELYRRKGIGENSNKDTREAVFGEYRRWERVNISDFEDYAATLHMLMGEEVPERKNFIMENVDFANIIE